MSKTAIGLFEDLATADKVVAHLLNSGFSRYEVKVVKRSDFGGTPGPETDILKIGGLPKEHAGRYWEAVRGGRVLVAVTSVGDAADRAAGIMDEGGAVDVGERAADPVESGGPRVAPSADPGFFPRRPAAKLFEVS
ncbi:MAG: hypothetical protein M3Y27_30800 [Acidobacteriota bacterium]|nr:hypothetical protein [Acidobacteriota bacterium]